MSKLSRALKWEFKALIELLSFRGKPKQGFQSDFVMEDFILVEEIGAYRHKVKPGMFCGVCVPVHRVYARMNKSNDGWKCFTCGKLYADPGGLLVVTPQAV